MLELSKISKSFGGLRAVDNLSLSIAPGRITSLIGPNGSGKTTVFNVVSGFLHPDAGSVHLDGVRISGRSVHEIARAGIGRTFQQIRLCPQMTVLDNILLARRAPIGERLLAAALLPSRLADEARENRKVALRLLERVKMDHKKGAKGAELSHGQRRLVEIARALALEPKVLLLDEPMSGLFPEMIQSTMQIIRELGDEGRTVFFIEHNMKVVLALSDHVVVLDDGRKLAEGTPSEIRSDSDVLTAYLGRGRSSAT